MPTYEQYQQAGGGLGKEGYLPLARTAWAYLDTMTLGKAALTSGALRGKVDSCFFALVDLLYSETQGGEVASATNDGYSETYVTSGKTAEERRRALVSLFLASTGLLSRRIVTTRVLSLRPVMVMPVASTPRPGALRRAAASTSTLA